MKNFIILFFLFFYCHFAFGQEKSDQFKIMLDSSVRMTYNFVLNGALHRHQKTDFINEIYLLDENYKPLDWLSDTVTRLFRFIDPGEERNREILSKGISVWMVAWALTDNRITIWIGDFTAKYIGDNHYNYATSGGGKAVFEFDCSTQKWVFKSFDYSGI